MNRLIIIKFLIMIFIHGIKLKNWNIYENLTILEIRYEQINFRLLDQLISCHIHI